MTQIFSFEFDLNMIGPFFVIKLQAKLQTNEIQYKTFLYLIVRGIKRLMNE